MTDTTRYSPAMIPAARTLAARGALDRDLAIAFGVPFPTIRAWKQRYPDFAAACRLPPDAADEAVERALFRKATGYDRDDERVVLKDGTLVRTTVTEHVPPCDKAATFWLRVRRPDRWGPPPPVPATSSDPAFTAQALRAIEEDACDAWCAARDGEPAMEGDDDALDRIDALAACIAPDPGAAPPAADDADPLRALEQAGDGARDTLPHRYEGAALPALTAAVSADPVDADPGPAAAPAYDPAHVALARRLAGQGALDRDLARAFGVDGTTLRQWMLRHAAFGAACRLAPAVADDAVENALFARATGYTYAREAVFLAEEEEAIRTVLLVALPPSLPAALFWLSRRRPERWSRRRRPGADPAEVARLIAETRARVADYDLHRRHWREHGCAPVGRAEPE